jgi:hypothetical protein
MEQDTFVHQSKYTKDMMKKFNMDDFKHMSTPMSTTTSLDPDENGQAIEQRKYRGMISSLLYLTVTQSDIQFTVRLCTLSDFPTLFTSDSSSANLQIPQIHS